jgi:endosialidase-like protein
MGFGDSLKFITGEGSTSNEKKNRRDARERDRYRAQGGADINASFQAQYEDPTNPNYKGPGYEVYIDDQGHAAARLVDADANAQWKNAQQAPVAPDLAAQTNQTLADTGQTQPQNPGWNATPVAAFQGVGPLTAQQRPATAPTAGGAFTSSIDQTGLELSQLGAAAGLERPPTAPTVNREQIDKLTGGLDAYQTALWEMGQDNTGLSAAEAQLKKATELANIQAGIATEQSQRSALGQARSARNRGDRTFLEQQAIGEAGFIGQEAARTAALRQAESEGNLATLRATEEDADRRFRLEAIKEAAGLGLNTAALELDISKADLASLTNQLNNDAAFRQLGMQIDQQKAEQVLGFTRDMAALQFQYDKMSVDDQNATDALLMQKYGIDQGTMLALKQLKASQDINWGQVLTQFVAGAGAGVTQAGAAKLFSDRRVKRDVKPVAPEELDELMSALKAETWDYIDEGAHGGGRSGRRFGPMAQDLERTRLGKAMVAEDLFGTKTVDPGAVAMATASGLAHVYDRLKGLEEAVK